MGYTYYLLEERKNQNNVNKRQTNDYIREGIYDAIWRVQQ